MSNIGSTALQTGKAESTRGPQARSRGQRQRAFDQGTMDMLNSARGAIENAAGQGAQLNPLIYQMLGLSPQMQDNSAELASAQQEYQGLQAQHDQAQARLDQLNGIPKGKRSKQQKQEFRQLKKQVRLGQKGLEDAHARFSQLQTAGPTITGFNRMDPNAIDATSPFSAQNPLYQAQQTEAQRLNQYLQGGEVDPTLKQQYTAAEAALRAKLTERFGPDYESTSVGQTALQNFGREKNEAFATWNQQQVEKYNSLAFQGQANLQTLLANQIGLYREPSSNQAGMAGAVSQMANQRLPATQTNQQERSITQGLSGTTVAGGNVAGALAGLASSPTMQGLANKGANALYNWATGAGAADAASTAAANDAMWTAAEAPTLAALA